ncbi:MotA/TolQ/ExbB proton channel family protein [Cruoricaptor ignavus]|uniref:MotA/TolQ/ExbB proton channel family protein n=1 Tax=Cruoricaptor ignavus TaxID=1118202 RepID=UPI00370D3A9C
MFLQADTPAAASVQQRSFSLWEILFHDNIFANAVMVAIILLGVLALYLFLERLFFINRMAKTPEQNMLQNIEDLLNEGRVEAAADYCKRSSSPDARILEKGISRIGRPVSDIVSAMESQAQIEVSRLEKNLSLLSAVPSIAPMLGLLGTVIGIIMAFFSMANSEGTFSPQTLSAGIYTALGHTAMGLAVAIPANFFYNLLLTRIDKFALKVQNLTADFLDIINNPS